MAGPMDIQRVPRGLVDLFGLKSTGDSPHVLSQQMQGGVDFLDAYLLDRVSTVQGVPAPNAPGVFQILSGPAFDEIWFVYHIAYLPTPLNTLNAASTYEASYEIYNQNTNNGLFIPGTWSGKLTVAGTWPSAGQAAASLFEKPLIMRSGDGFQANVYTYTGTGLNGYPVLRVKRAVVKI